MKILITGAFGQDGRILSRQLKKNGHSVFGSYLPGFDDPDRHAELSRDKLLPLEITDVTGVEAALNSVSPDAVIHLAGETSVANSWLQPTRTMQTNLIGTTSILEWIQNCKPDTHFVNATSVEVFDERSNLVSEASEMKAKNPYGISKLATAQLVSAMRADGLSLSNAFLSNHESIYRPEKFVVGKVARGVAAIADGKQSQLVLGDISIIRDWSSAHDICQGIRLIVETGYVGDLILASGTNHQLSEIVELAFKSAGISNWKDYVQTDVSLLRTNDERVATYDISAANREIGWKPVETIDVWIGNMVKHFRENV